MSNIFQELQMVANASAVNTVEASRKQLNEIVNYFKQRSDYSENQEWFAKLRNLKTSILNEADGFFIDESVKIFDIPQELRHDSLGLCKGSDILYSGRYVYPVKDVKGDVMGWCGYDKFEDIKYLDSINYGYKANNSTYYGMEKMREYYSSNKPVFFVEGIVCCNWLRQEGFQSLASLGSYLSPYMITIAQRLGDRAIFITDSDESGTKYRNQVKRTLPRARSFQSIVAKDVDDSRQVVPDLAEDLRGFNRHFYRSKYFK